MSIAPDEGALKRDDSLDAPTSDGQTVKVDATVIFRINEEKASDTSLGKIAEKVFKDGDDPKVVYEYERGGYFGELALLKNEPRAASVIAKVSI